MPREKEGYRANLELLNNRFPDKDALNITDVARFLGQSVKTVRRKIMFNETTGLVTKADLARQVSL